MNSVSWFLYIADVVGRVGFVAALTSIACIGFLIACLVGQAVSEGDLSKECPNMWKYFRRAVVAAIAFGMFASLFPSKNTMYAIAAAEVGERVIASEKVQGIADDATKALQSWLRKQIDGEKKADK